MLLLRKYKFLTSNPGTTKGEKKREKAYNKARE
jgi:hypothetical protein